MKETIGYCSLCGGEVRREMGPWGSIFPPIASCSKCGATESKGPTIQMVPNRSKLTKHDPLLNQSERQRDLLSRW